jgi:hypothetical protein
MVMIGRVGLITAIGTLAEEIKCGDFKYSDFTLPKL